MDTNPSQVSSQQNAGTHLPTHEGWKAELHYGGKKVTQNNVQISAELTSYWGPYGLKAEILVTVPTTRAHSR